MNGGRTGSADVIAGSPSASRFLRRVAGDPTGPLTAAVVGPGGTGKTAVLEAVAETYRRAGVEPVHADGTGGRFDPGTAVLIDDAHRLDAATLTRLQSFAQLEQSRLVVAYRPWPASRSLSRLVSRRSPRGMTVVVGHLDRDAVEARLAERLDCEPPPAFVEFVHEQSGGLPALVEIVTSALVEVGRFDPREPDRFRRPQRLTISPPLAQRLRHFVDVLEPDVYELLEVLAVGATLEADVLARLLHRDPAQLAATVEAARGTGLLTENAELIPFIRTLMMRLAPVLDTREMQRELAAVQLERGGSVLEAGRQMLGTGATGSRVATIFETAGDEALRESPALAAELYAGAANAGAAPGAVAARRATAVALAGDLGEALRLADAVISDPEAPDRERALTTAAVALAHRGMLGRSATLLMDAAAVGGTAVLAVPALVGTGALAEARAVLDRAQSRPPNPASLLDGAGTMLAGGMIASVTGSAPAALSQLARAAVLLEPVAASVLLPDTPAALTALVALHCGELTVADTALHRAAGGRHGGRPAHVRHLLLHGWHQMMRGRFDAARRTLDRTAHPERHLEPRDELFAAALEVALARRDEDPAALRTAWSRARTALVHHPADLYTLLPLGELAVGATQLGEQDWIAAHLDDAWRLLACLGDPALWAAPLRWGELQAAVVGGQRAEAERHAEALGGSAFSGPYAHGLAAAAASWLQVQWGEIDAEAVQTAARRLHALGLRWEGARLAGQGAARAADRRAVTALHACARQLYPASAPADTASLPGDGATEGSVPTAGAEPSADPASTVPQAQQAADAAPVGDHGDADAQLSDRELDIGQLILEGLTYKQIGQRLFISAKTVEHHVARMRQRLGVASRNELFGRLRLLLGATAAPAD